MRQVQRSALVRHSASEMFSLVDDIELYPEFLPWCSDAVVHSRENGSVEATLKLQRGDLSKSFRTRNTASGHDKIAMQLVDGPFRHLDGRWSFTQLGESGSKVALDLEFEFSSSVVDMLLGPFFEDICNSLVDAFTQRAEKVYGQAST
ncbi:MAG: type II toxin-antitoxin system RatA family toxin [Gammaproteobacteria bacterium]